MNDSSALLPLVNRFFDKDLEGAVHILESMTEEEAAQVLKSLPITLSVRILKVLQISYAATLLKNADNAFLREIASHLDFQMIASILMQLPKEARERMSAHLTDQLKEQVRELLDYPVDSVGRTMTTDFIALRKDNNAEEAIEKIRTLAKKRFPSSYVYVVDESGPLMGVLNMRDLMLASPEKKLGEIGRRDFFALHSFTSRQTLALMVWFINEMSGLTTFCAKLSSATHADARLAFSISPRMIGLTPNDLRIRLSTSLPEF